MKVEDVMTRSIATCSRTDTLNEAARMMWDCDCGAVPVVNDDGTVAGIVTDRDICMAAYTSGQPLAQINVTSAMSRSVHSCAASDDLDDALEIMKENRVRRLPVTDGERVIGILSIGDALTALRSHQRKADRGEPVDLAVEALVMICEPRFSRRMVDRGNGNMREARAQ